MESLVVGEAGKRVAALIVGAATSAMCVSAMTMGLSFKRNLCFDARGAAYGHGYLSGEIVIAETAPLFCISLPKETSTFGVAPLISGTETVGGEV